MKQWWDRRTVWEQILIGILSAPFMCLGACLAVILIVLLIPAMIIDDVRNDPGISFP